jgi:hypothetical protein
MTATLLAAASRSTAGNATEPLPWDRPRIQEASTYLELGTVANPALRDVLAQFASESEPLLCLSESIPGAVVLRRAVNSSVDQHIRVFISGTTADVRPHLQVLRWLASTTGELLPTDEAAGLEGWADAPEQTSATVEVGAPSRASDVVEVVEWLAQQLDVPDGDIIEAAKIKRRNWHNWKNGRRPRLESQGQLWALLNSVRALSDMFDEGAAPWFKAGGDARRSLLTSGQHRKLVQEALKEAALRGEFAHETRRKRRQKSAAGFFE